MSALVDDGGQVVSLVAELTHDRANHLIALINEWSFTSLRYPQGLLVERMRNWVPGTVLGDVFLGGGWGHDHDHDNGGDDHDDGGDESDDDNDVEDDHDDVEDGHVDVEDEDDDGDDSMVVDYEGKTK